MRKVNVNSEETSCICRVLFSAWSNVCKVQRTEVSKGKPRISVADLCAEYHEEMRKRGQRDRCMNFVPGAGIFTASPRCMLSRNDM